MKNLTISITLHLEFMLWVTNCYFIVASVAEYLSEGAIINSKIIYILYKEGWKFAKIDAIVQNGHFIG